MEITKIEKGINTVYCNCSDFDFDYSESPLQQRVSYETLPFNNTTIRIENKDYYYVKCSKCKRIYVKQI